MAEEFIKLKVYKNKKNSQGVVVIPKKKFGTIPEYIRVKIKRRKK